MTAPFPLSFFEENIHYNEETGILTWKVDRNYNAKAGDECGSFDTRGYRQINILGKVLKGHKVAWFLHYKVWPEQDIDHINCDRADNRISNLRLANRHEQMRNTRVRKQSKTQIKGVHYDRSRDNYQAFIHVNGRRKHLGRFASAEDAHNAYCNAADYYYAEFANYG